MLHKQIAGSYRSSVAGREGLRLVSPGEERRPASAAPELIAILSRRCSSFFAEAAVLVLVFGILDFFFQHGRVSLPWAAGAIGLSVALLLASVATDFTAGRWLGAHP